MFIHTNDTAWNGLQRITIVTNVTDIVVIALYTFSALKLNELWIEYGVGKNQRWLPIYQFTAKLGGKVGSAFPYWYVLTGCDTMSSFAGRGKKKAWDTWKAYPEVTDSFIRLVAVLNLFDILYFAVHYKKCFINVPQTSVVVVVMY